MFKVNEKVHLITHGVATIVATIDRDFGDGTKSYYKIVKEAGPGGQPPSQHFIPVDRAKDLLRKTVAKKDATDILELLKAKKAPKGKLASTELKTVVESGDLREMALLLRREYENEEPIKKQAASTIAQLEELLFGELATVLKIEPQAIQKDVRKNYPQVTEYFDKL